MSKRPTKPPSIKESSAQGKKQQSKPLFNEKIGSNFIETKEKIVSNAQNLAFNGMLLRPDVSLVTDGPDLLIKRYSSDENQVVTDINLANLHNQVAILSTFGTK